MKENYKIKSSSDNLEIDILEIKPDKKIKAIIQLAHGMAEHKERYIPFMKYLSNEGYLCVINDHRGHGESVKDKSHLGYFYEDNADYIIEDIYDISKIYKNKYPDVPFILFGHSMGSMVVRKYLKKHDDILDGLIVCGAPFKNDAAKLGKQVANIIGKFKGDKHRSKLINNMAFGTFDSKFKGNNKNRWLSANEDNVKYYNNEEKCGFIFTINGFKNLFNLMIDIYDPNGYELKNENLPIYFIAGEDDPVIGNEKKWLQAQDFLKDIGYKNISNTLYPNMRHEILNEKDAHIVYQDVLKFIQNI